MKYWNEFSIRGMLVICFFAQKHCSQEKLSRLHDSISIIFFFERKTFLTGGIKLGFLKFY